ncbi:MAG: hypothetical protein MUO52_15020 [Desulfobacterales bacterium]|nr:hypothetical protein [Desulfobacterales bacterium]
MMILPPQWFDAATLFGNKTGTFMVANQLKHLDLIKGKVGRIVMTIGIFG